MIITIDYDNDEIRIDDQRIVGFDYIKSRTGSAVQNLLNEILNRIKPTEDYLNVELVKQDEGQLKTVSEW